MAGNLDQKHDLCILDLKVEPDALVGVLTDFRPDIVGLTGMTCEANTVVKIAGVVKELSTAVVVVGGIHASNDPVFFNRSTIDYIVIGLGKQSFRELVLALEQGQLAINIPGIAQTSVGSQLIYSARRFGPGDLADESPPAYELVEKYRRHYALTTLDLDMGFVATAYGCPFRCSFCCIKALTNGKYLSHSIDAVLRDIRLLESTPLIRLLDANTFGSARHADELCQAILDAGIQKQFLADVRSDTVVKYPHMMARWKSAGLRAVIVGFEEVSDNALLGFNKGNSVKTNNEAISILHDLGITIVGDFIIDPSYDDHDFDNLARYIAKNKIDLPMITVLTPLPGTDLYRRMKKNIIVNDLDYYTLTNAVMPTKLSTHRFYTRYSNLVKMGHECASL